MKGVEELRGANHARSFGADTDTRRCRYIYQGRICESLQWLLEFAGAAKIRRGFQRLWLTLVLVFLVMPTNALALTASDMGVVWGPNPVGRWGSGESDEQGVICVANNAFNAALVTCGVSTNDERLTFVAKAKLSNRLSGGNFYTLSQCFSCFQGNDGYDYPAWNRSATGVVDSMANLFGPENVWWGLYESYLLTSAKEDLSTILNGGSLGGGSGSGTGTTSYTYTGKAHYYSGTSANYGNNKFQNGDKIITFALNDSYDRMPAEYYIKFRNTDLQDMYTSYPTSDYDYYAAVSSTSNSSSATGWSWIINIYAIPKGKAVLTYETLTVGDTTNRVPLILKAESSTRYYSLRITAVKATYSDSVFTINAGSVGTVQSATASTGNIINKSQNSGVLGTVYVMGGPDDTPVTPPTNWPDEPTQTPVTPPEVPEYDEPVSGNPPDYTPYSITTPYTDTSTGNVYVYNTYNTYSFDYTNSYPPDDYTDLYGWLNSIFNQLKLIQMRLTINLIELSGQIEDMIKGNDANTAQIVAKLEQIIRAINNAGSTVNSTLGRVQAAIDAGLGAIYELIGDFMADVHADFVSIGSYMENCIVWLAEQIEYSMGDGYDDSSLLFWLKRIYNKLGAGRVNTRPTDPVADPVGIGDWLAQLFQNFLGGLLGIGGEALDAVLDALGDLREKFPFSIPWDLAAILGLLVADPVAPNFDVPQYTITSEGLQQVATYHIDLSAFDDVMVGVRTMETLVFAFCLAFKTDFFKGLLTVHGGE